jgi:hypothetical protein
MHTRAKAMGSHNRNFFLRLNSSACARVDSTASRRKRARESDHKCAPERGPRTGASRSHFTGSCALSQCRDGVRPISNADGARLIQAMVESVPSLAALDNPLTSAQRLQIHAELSSLLEWQRELQHWVAPGSLPTAALGAMPIVSLYARGELRGCFAYEEGPAQHRLARAFLAALSDSRFGPVTEESRRDLVAQVAYPIRVRELDPTTSALAFRAGVHGLSLVGPARKVLLVPDVARDLGLDEEGFVCALEQKAELPRSRWHTTSVFAFETERVVARTGHAVLRRPTPLAGALDWLSAQVEPDGGVRFGLDSSSGEVSSGGFMRHARAATLVQALALAPRHRDTRDRARAWLQAEVQRALSGVAVEDWPSAPAVVSGTLALCCLAGLSLEPILLARASDSALYAEPWHAAQVAAALGLDTPSALWQACVASLDDEPFAPWTAIAAARRGDRRTFERALSLLRENIPEPSAFGFVAEPALAALTAEALALDPNSRAQHSASLALLERCQLWADTHPAASPEWAHGAFAVAPNQRLLRVDVTAHAALALATVER